MVTDIDAVFLFRSGYRIGRTSEYNPSTHPYQLQEVLRGNQDCQAH